MLPAESAVLVHLESVGGILFVFHCVVVALLALSACKSDLNSHNGTSIFNVSLPLTCIRRLRSDENRVQKKDPSQRYNKCTTCPGQMSRAFMCFLWFRAENPHISRRFVPSGKNEASDGTLKDTDVHFKQRFSE